MSREHKPIRIKVNDSLGIAIDDLPHDVFQDIADTLTIDNIEKEKALKEAKYRAEDMADHIQMFEIEGDQVWIPRGFAIQLIGGLTMLDLDYEIIDERIEKPSRFYFNAMTPVDHGDRFYQREAIEDMLDAEQGIYWAPTGSGKTVTALELLRQIGSRALIIVNKIELADQWRNRAKDWLGVDIGFIGSGQWDERPVTVALQQTLWSRMEGLDNEDWWDRWGTVILDECHAVQADTYLEIMSRFAAKYRFGLSATPAKTGDFRISETMLGPICARTTRQDLFEAGVLIRPEIEMIPTDFGFSYKGTTRKDDGRVSRNNYPKLINQLIENKPRNKLIVKILMENIGQANLIFTDRLDHIDALIDLAIDAGFPIERVFRLTGQEKRQERARIIDDVTRNGDCAIFSTVADEGLDIPILNRGYLAYPVGNVDRARQIMGRFERGHPRKKKHPPILYDFADLSVGPLEGQYKRRQNQIYRQDRLIVRKRKKVKSA